MQSLHQKAWKDPVFQKAYAIEPLAFCRGCHAPESDPAKEPTAAAQALGIGCVSCHVDDAGVHAVRASGRAQHAVVADAELGTRAVCARCHQFDFPAEARLPHPVPMQDTANEHATSSTAATPCQGCHMPVVDGPEGKHKSHAFSVLADATLVRRAVEVVAQRTDTEKASQVTLRITAAQVGHAFPTGDMFRRVELRAVALDAADRVVARANPIVLQRRFEDRPRELHRDEFDPVRVEAEDTRVPPPGKGAKVATLRLPPEARDLRLRWTVVYQRMSTPMADAFGLSQVLDEIVVATGELAPHKIAQWTGGSR